MSASGPSSTHEKIISSIGVELYHAIDKLDDSNVKRILANDPLPPWEDIKPTLETLSDDGTPEALLKKVAHSNEFIFDQVINAYFEFFNDELIRSLLILFVENNNHAALCEYLPYSSDALLYTHFKSLISLAARNKNLDILDTLIQETQTDTATEYWATTAVYDVLLTAVKTQDVDFLNDILKKLPLPLIRQEVPSVLETICFYYPNEDDSIKALLLSPISDEIRILRLSSAITQNSLNIVQLILPTITAISDRSLISIIRKARYNKDIYQMIKAHYKNQIIKMLSEQLTSLNITDNIALFSKLIFYLVRIQFTLKIHG